jgi:cysteine desulfurase
MSDSEIYLDYNSTTPVLPDVLERMLPYFSHDFGNASSSTHAMGWRAKAAVDLAREEVATLIGASFEEIIFTSGATESINLAITGAFEVYGKSRNHIVTIATEHAAVLETCLKLQVSGAIVTILPVMADGTISIDALKSVVSERTCMVVAMMANNETGVVLPIKEIAAVAHEKGALFFSDTTQAPGKLRLNVEEEDIDLCCLSAHKFYGPKGVGALYIRKRRPKIKLNAVILGGGQENGLRSGTLNVPGIVGMGAAASIAQQDWWDDAHRISVLRTKLEHSLLDLGNVTVNGSTKFRLPNTSNLCFKNLTASLLIKDIQPLCVATGSACSSGNNQPSHVLTNMGLSGKDANSSIRFSLGKQTTEAEIDTAISKIKKAIEKNAG